LLIALQEAEQYPINRRQIGCTSTGPINDKQLQFHEKAVGDDGLGSARSQKFGECRQKMGE